MNKKLTSYRLKLAVHAVEKIVGRNIRAFDIFHTMNKGKVIEEYVSEVLICGSKLYLRGCSLRLSG